MATHSSILAWRILWSEEPGRPQSMGHKESDRIEWLSTHMAIKILPTVKKKNLQLLQFWPLIFVFINFLICIFWLRDMWDLSSLTRDPTCTPWMRSSEWQPTPVFLPRKSHRERTLVGYSPWGLERVRHDLANKQKTLMIYCIKPSHQSAIWNTWCLMQ